jgi:hypothetical protein
LKANKDLKRILGEKIEDRDLDLEAIRYSLWLDPIGAVLSLLTSF